MALSKHKNKEELAREILAYFLRNPQSADDLRGIANWRLLDETIHRALHETSEAIELLVSQGFLAVDSITGSERIYRLNHEKREDASHFMKESETPD